MCEEEEIEILGLFMEGLRELNPQVEMRKPDIAEMIRSGSCFTTLDIWRYLVNPARNNSGYTWEDGGDGVHFQELRLHYNKVDDLVRGLPHIGLIPRFPQRLGTTIDRYNGHSADTTSGILIRRIGCPAFGCGFANEIEWVPAVFTLGGRFPVGHFGIVATRVQYKMTNASIAKEAIFIGEMWVTLANRQLAELYKDILSDNVKINGNRECIEVQWAGYMLSSKDIGDRVNCARVDKRAWQFPAQFDDQDRFIVNGPDCTSLNHDSVFLTI